MSMGKAAIEPGVSRRTAARHLREGGGINGAVDCLGDRAEKVSRRDGQRLAATYEHAAIGIAEVDKDGRLLRVNPQLCALTGYSADELIGRSIFDGTYPDDVELDRQQFRNQVAGEVSRYSIAKRIRRKDGGFSWASVTSSGVRDSRGRFLYAVRVLHDSSERKRAEYADQWLASIIESSNDAIISKDLNGIIATWNPRAERLFGYKAEEVIGKPITILMPPDRQDEEVGILEKVRRGEGVDHHETVRQRKDGTLIDISLTVSPVRDGEGRVIGASKIARDITERKQAENQQRILLDELNHRVKNNMQMLQSLLHSAARETPSAEARTALADASQRVAAMAAAQRVLYGTFDAMWFDADEFMSAVCKTAEQMLGPGIEIACESAAGQLSNDKAMPLALILNELLTNAARHGLKGGDGVIRAGLTKDGETFVLYVEDSGPGFDLQSVRKRSSGLGLVQGLARQLRADFEVRRQPTTRCMLRFQ